MTAQLLRHSPIRYVRTDDPENASPVMTDDDDDNVWEEDFDSDDEVMAEIEEKL